jgi:hypothetical protein
MAKTQKQRSAEFRARKAETPEVRGIYTPAIYHDDLKAMLAHYWGVTIATKREKRKA